MSTIKAYKGFNKNMTCRGFQYEIGKEYETDKAKLCNAGFHACEHPLDVWDYYPPTDGNRFCQVEQSGEKETDGTKTGSSKIKIGAEIRIAGLVKAHIEWISEQTRSIVDKVLHPLKPISESKNWAKIGSSGDGAKIGSSGYGAKIGSSGDWAQIGSSGDGAKIGSSGNEAKIECTGKNAVVACAGINNIVKAPLGTWVCLSKYNDNGICIGMKAFKVDGEKYPADKWLKLMDGEIVEA